jgi:hypothetical protein
MLVSKEPPASASKVLELQARTTMAGLTLQFIRKVKGKMEGADSR